MPNFVHDDVKNLLCKELDRYLDVAPVTLL